MSEKEREERFAENSEFLRSNSGFLDLPQRFQELVLKSPNASADYKEFFAHGGRIVADPDEPLAIFRAEPNRELHVNQGQYDFAKTREGAHLVGVLFSRMAHEIGHDKDRTASFPPAGVPDTAEAYVQFRSEKEAKAIFNAFPIFADLEKNEPSFVKNGERRWAALGYSVMGVDWPVLYDRWHDGRLDDATAIKEIAKRVADYPYTRTDGLSDQNQDGKLTQRDLYLRDYQGLLRHREKPGTSPQTLNVDDVREPQQPQHAMLQQIRSHVRDLADASGRPFDQRSEQLSHSLLTVARENGMTQVDHLIGSRADASHRAGEDLFVVQGRLNDPAHIRASVNVELASQTPVANSQRQLDAVEQRLAVQHTAQQQALAQSRDQGSQDNPHVMRG